MLQKIKYIIFSVIFLLIIYQLLSSFNVVPYLFTGQDMNLVIMLIVSLFLLLIGFTIDRLYAKIPTFREEIDIGKHEEVVQPPELQIPKTFKEKEFYKYFIAMQNYIKFYSDMRELIDKLLVAAAKVTHSERASIMLYDRKSDELYITRTLGWNSSEIKLIKGTRIRPGEGIAGRVFLDGKPVVMNETGGKEEVELKEKYKSNSFISFPVLSGNSIIGVLNLTEKVSGGYTKYEIDMVNFIINEVAMHLLYMRHTVKEKL